MFSILVTLVLIIMIYFAINSRKKNNFTIFTQALPSMTGSIRLTETYNYPTCYTGVDANIGCINENNNAIMGFEYKTSDGRCFSAINDVPINTLNRIVNKDSTISPSTYFKSCEGSTGTTMYTPTIGRYIRLQTNITNTNPIKLSKLEAYTDSGFVQPIDVHVNPMVYGQNYLLLTNQNNTTEVLTGNGNRAYVQIDLGANYIIKEIKLVRSLSDTNATYLKNCTLSLIQDMSDPSANVFTNNGVVTFQIMLTDTTVGLTDL